MEVTPRKVEILRSPRTGIDHVSRRTPPAGTPATRRPHPRRARNSPIAARPQWRSRPRASDRQLTLLAVRGHLMNATRDQHAYREAENGPRQTRQQGRSGGTQVRMSHDVQSTRTTTPAAQHDSSTRRRVFSKGQHSTNSRLTSTSRNSDQQGMFSGNKVSTGRPERFGRNSSAEQDGRDSSPGYPSPCCCGRACWPRSRRCPAAGRAGKADTA